MTLWDGELNVKYVLKFDFFFSFISFFFLVTVISRLIFAQKTYICTFFLSIQCLKSREYRILLRIKMIYRDACLIFNLFQTFLSFHSCYQRVPKHLECYYFIPDIDNSIKIESFFFLVANKIKIFNSFEKKLVKIEKNNQKLQKWFHSNFLITFNHYSSKKRKKTDIMIMNSWKWEIDVCRLKLTISWPNTKKNCFFFFQKIQKLSSGPIFHRKLIVRVCTM